MQPLFIRLNHGGLALHPVQSLLPFDVKRRTHLKHVRILFERVIITNFTVVLQLLHTVRTSSPMSKITSIRRLFQQLIHVLVNIIIFLLLAFLILQFDHLVNDFLRITPFPC